MYTLQTIDPLFCLSMNSFQNICRMVSVTHEHVVRAVRGSYESIQNHSKQSAWLLFIITSVKNVQLLINNSI